MNRELWLENRRKGIGSSDAAAICGLSDFGNPLSVYLDKLGLLPPRESPEMSWGTRLEQAIADAYQEETGLTCLPPPEVIAQHRVFPWMLASVDRIAHDNGRLRVVELKTSRTSHGWGEPGTDAVPEAYLVQVQHQMAVTGADVADVAVLIGGSDFRVYTVPRSTELAVSLAKIEADFWRRVLNRIPPPADWSDPRTPELIALLHRPTEGKAITLSAVDAALANEYAILSEAISESEKKKKRIKGMLIESMADAECGRLSDGRTIRRKEVHRKAYVVAETTYFDFRISTPKE